MITASLTLRIAMSCPRVASALLLGGLLLHPHAALAVPDGGISTPLPTRVDHYNPDLQVCKPEAIRTTFASQLQPFADQPAEVLAQLRRVQLDMVQATLQRCISKGLMEPSEAASLARQLGLETATPPR